MSVATYTKTGNKSSTSTKLDKAVFGIDVQNHELIQQVYVAQQANARNNNATTKLRGEVRGGGRKPWRQKGTGKARAGSIRSPLWRGGGITFGPSTDQNFSKKINKRAKQTALRHALSSKHAADAIVVIDAFETDGKTQAAAKLIAKIAPTAKRALLVIDEFTDTAERATRNIAHLKIVTPNYLNIVDTLDADIIILTKKSHDTLAERLGGTK